MARAKRTQRADARRRYRAQVAAEQVEPDASAPSAERRPAAQERTPAPAVERPSISRSFTSAFRRPNYAEDLRLLPQLLTHRSVWLPVAITVGTTVLLFATGGRDLLSALLAQYFILTPPIGGIFLSGFLAPRASYLTGAITGLAAAVCLAVILASGFASRNEATPGASASPASTVSGSVVLPSGSTSASPAVSASPAASGAASASAVTSPSAAASASPEVSPTPSPAPGVIATSTPEQAILAAFLISPLTGAVFGAAAAWYRRFLNLANPSRNQPPAKRRQNQRRR